MGDQELDRIIAQIGEIGRNGWEESMFNERDGLQITVQRSELLTALRANREKHVAEYKEAEFAFREAAIAKLKESLAAVEVHGADPRRHMMLDLDVPQSHEREYTTVIRMLEMATDSHIVIAEAKYLQYVEDEWAWKAGFNASTMAYKKR